MFRFLSLILAFFLLCTSTVSPTFAKPTKAPGNIIATLKKKPQEQIVTEKELFIAMVDIIAEYGEIPTSYRYVKVENTGEMDFTRLYRAYQKAVYLDILKPSQIPLKFSGVATHKKLVNFTNLFYGEKKNGTILVNGSELQVIDKKLNYGDLAFYANNYLNVNTKPETGTIQNAEGYELLADAYQRLMTEHVDHAGFDQKQMMYGAIEGMAKGTGDEYTVFFPPAESQEFAGEINGEFEGIGAMLDMTLPGELMITAVIPGSPAEKSGIFGGDRIVKIDDFEVVKTSSVEQLVPRIKGPAGTVVKLIIERKGEKIEKSITRAKIKMEMVNYAKLDSNTSVIRISSFGDGTIGGFRKAVDQMEADKTKRVIIDLRNDGGGNVREVSDILDYFVPTNQNKFSMKTLVETETAVSSGLDDHFKNREIVFLINGGTASASEILVLSVQDYLPTQTKIVGEKSFGKGSAQQLFEYNDGSSLKFTIAKWYSGKNGRTIDKVGIKPDFEIVLDEAKFRQGIDNQLEYAKSLKY
jgi:carboxyl-terminal processing protease